MTALLLAGCQQREEILEGERQDVRGPGDGTAEAASAEANRSLAIRLPAPRANAEWTHRNGSPGHRMPHPALAAAPVPLWSAPIGQGNTRRLRITADPVVAAGRIFTLDAAATVSAVSTAGASLWQRDLTPTSERAGEASGGGLAFGAGRLFVTSGFGLLSALDPATGAVLWSQRLDATATSAPTVYGDLVYVTSRDSRAWAIKAETGRIEWELPGSPTPSVMQGGASPAITERLAVFPFGSGELLAVLRRGGVRVWGATLAGQRRGQVYATISDITGDPVVDGGVLYVGNQSGRTAALRLANGERLWTAPEGAYSPVWPEGGSVFLISDQARLVRLDAASGARIWAVEMPYFRDARTHRRRGVYAHYGPVLAGGRLWVASSDGWLRAFAPEDGRAVYELELPGGAAANPVVAGAVLYVVSADGELHAFR